jgi:uncharacterized protein YndB with AHSA1/START domain
LARAVVLRGEEKGTTMPSIVIERTIVVAPQRAFDALTGPADLAQWWTNDVSATPEVGSLAEFRFRQGVLVYRFEVTELVSAERVRWVLRHGPDHWVGTGISWQLTPEESGTKLVFTQDGFAHANALFARTVVEWTFYLDSLKAYLETGKGTPYVRGELDPL